MSQEALTAFLASVAAHIGATLSDASVPLSDAPTALPMGVAPTGRDAANAAAALEAETAKLRAMKPGDGRNNALNVAAHSLGTLIGNGSIEASTVTAALSEACKVNGHLEKHGEAQTINTIESGIKAGIEKPRPLLAAAIVSSVLKSKAKRSVELVQGSQIEAVPITWLWEGYLPLGKLALLAGAGGTGKSTLAISLAATITTAGTWPDGTKCAMPGNVLIWSGEDSMADTIKPRLMAVGADPIRYGVIGKTTDENNQKKAFDSSKDMQCLRDAVARIGGIALLIIDPIVTAVTGDMHKANDVRRSLQAIVDFATECNCSVLGITHFAKGTAGRNSAERVIGSQAFAALARMVLVTAKEEESHRRVFTRAKSNNSIDNGGFRYTIEPVSLHRGIVATRVVWGEPLEGSSRSILANIEGDGTDDSSQLGKAKQFLLRELGNGPVPSKQLLESAREAMNISDITLRRAKQELGIIARKQDFAGGWVWELPLAGTAKLLNVSKLLIEPVGR